MWQPITAFLQPCRRVASIPNRRRNPAHLHQARVGVRAVEVLRARRRDARDVHRHRLAPLKHVPRRSLRMQV
jgi:hypothetical protein